MNELLKKLEEAREEMRLMVVHNLRHNYEDCFPIAVKGVFDHMLAIDRVIQDLRDLSSRGMIQK